VLDDIIPQDKTIVRKTFGGDRTVKEINQQSSRFGGCWLRQLNARLLKWVKCEKGLFKDAIQKWLH